MSENPTALAVERSPPEKFEPLLVDGDQVLIVDGDQPEAVVSIKRDQGGRFVKGVSGNLKGRPTIEGQFKQRARSHSSTAIAKLVQLLESKNEKIVRESSEDDV
jgi:hypothetical protein